MTTPQQWARLQTESDEVKIRRGAWYKVLKLGPVEVVLDVNRKAIPIPRIYLRLRRHDYGPDDIRAWADRVRPFLEAGLDAYVFFRHDESGRGPELAGELTAAFAAA